jgi:hypothetical protein
MDNAKAIRAAIQNKDDNASKIRGALSPNNMGEGFLGGVEARVQGMASMFSGDPEMRGLPPAREVPDTLGGRMGAASFDAAAMAVPGGQLAGAMPRASQGATGILSKIQNAVSDIGQTYKRAPTTFIAAEAGMGGASGAGGYYAEQMFPDSDAARFIGEIAGGMAPSAAMATGRGAVSLVDRVSDISPTVAAAKNYARNTWDEVATAIDAKTAGTRATQRFGRAIGDTPAQDVIGTMDEELLPAARSIMTPAQISGNRGLLSLERSLAESSDRLRNRREEDLTRLNEVIRASFQTGGDVSVTQRAMETTRQDYINLLNERVRVAGLRADESIQRMLPELGEEGANRAARSELERALRDATNQERQLYDMIDFSAIAPTQNTQGAFRDIVAEAGRAGSRSVPDYARDLFSREGRNFLGNETSVKELREAQSQFRGIARNARVGSDPDRRLAMFADRMADAITEDLALTQGADPELIRSAVDYSRAKNEVFRQGTVGRILRTASDSGDVIPEMLTLEQTLGVGGPRGAQAVDDIVSAAQLARERAGYEGADNLAGAMANYVSGQFIKSATRNGQLDQGLAQTFIRNNETLLTRFPEIRQGIEEAVATGSVRDAQEALRRAGISTVDDPAVSKAALLINKGPVEAFKSVLSARSGSHEMGKLVSLVGKDETGEALQGLKQGFFDFLLNESSQAGTVSGARLGDLVGSQQARGAIERLFDRDEQRRLYTIIRTAQRADAARSATPSVEGVTGDRISRTSEALLGVLGAAYGREVSTRMGGGTVQIPGIFANRFRELGAAGMGNPAKRLIVDALQDEKLFREVLMGSADASGNLPEAATRRLNAWAAGALIREGLSEDEDQQVNTDRSAR